MRIVIPENPDDLVALAKAIEAKHTALGAASPLNGINNIASFGPLVTTADNNNQQAKSLSEQAKTATEARDNALGQRTQLTPGTVRYFVTAARDVLLGLNKGSEHKLGDWNFQVIAAAASNNSAKTPAQPKPAGP
jgi:hypothetical protein